MQYCALQTNKADAQRSATKHNKPRAFVKLASSLESFRWQNCYGAKADWEPECRNPQRGREPKEGWFTSQYHFKAAWEARNASSYTDTKVYWKGHSDESHPIAVYVVQFKDLAIQNSPSLRQLHLSNYNIHFSTSLPSCLEWEILQHF